MHLLPWPRPPISKLQVSWQPSGQPKPVPWSICEVNWTKPPGHKHSQQECARWFQRAGNMHRKSHRPASYDASTLQLSNNDHVAQAKQKTCNDQALLFSWATWLQVLDADQWRKLYKLRLWWNNDQQSTSKWTYPRQDRWSLGSRLGSRFASTRRSPGQWERQWCPWPKLCSTSLQPQFAVVGLLGGLQLAKRVQGLWCCDLGSNGLSRSRNADHCQFVLRWKHWTCPGLHSHHLSQLVLLKSSMNITTCIIHMKNNTIMYKVAMQMLRTQLETEWKKKHELCLLFKISTGMPSSPFTSAFPTS